MPLDGVLEVDPLVFVDETVLLDVVVMSLVVVDEITVPVAFSFSAVIEEIISTLSTVAEEIKISLSSDLIWNKDPNPVEDTAGTITTLKTSGASWLCKYAANSVK